MKKYLITFLILFSNLNLLNADDRINKLNKLFNDLKIKNSSIANKAEQKIWKIWSTHPSDEKLTLL